MSEEVAAKGTDGGLQDKEGVSGVQEEAKSKPQDDSTLLYPLDASEPKNQRALASISYDNRGRNIDQVLADQESGSNFLPSTYLGPQPCIAAGAWSQDNVMALSDSSTAEEGDEERRDNDSKDSKDSKQEAQGTDDKGESCRSDDKSHAKGTDATKQ